MKILITGGAGFIGSHLAEELVRRQHRVFVIDNLSSGRRENLPLNVSLDEADIRDGRALEAIFDRIQPETVVHLAAQANVRKSLVDPVRDTEVNVFGSLHLFQAALRSGVGRLVYASSGGAVYGEQPRYPCSESDVPRPASPYGVSKLAAEQYGRQLAEAAGRDFVSLRLANVYGPRQDPAGEAGVIALFLSELLAGRSPTLFGDGGQTRDFIWVGDVVEAFVKALEGPAGIYNVGTGKETRIRDLYLHLARAVGSSVPARTAAGIVGEVRRNALAIALAQDRLSWSPRTDLGKGLEATVEFFKSATIPNGLEGAEAL